MKDKSQVAIDRTPIEVNQERVAHWIRLGDRDEAERAAQNLITFLRQAAGNKEIQQAIMRSGGLWLGKDIALLLAERLDAKKIAKLLVPQKPSKSMYKNRYLAYLVCQFPRDDTGRENAMAYINGCIKENQEAKASGARWNSNLPDRAVTLDQLNRIYLRFKDEVDAMDK
jgi:hypothetical protein